MTTRNYYVPATNITVANAAVTLVFVNVGTSRSLRFRRAWCGNYEASATNGKQRVQLSTQVTAFPTLTSQTPIPVINGDTASAITGGTAGAAGTSGINASAEGAGTKTVLLPDIFHLSNGWLYVPTPEERPGLLASGSAGLGLHLPAAAAVLTGWSAGLAFEEQ